MYVYVCIYTYIYTHTRTRKYHNTHLHANIMSHIWHMSHTCCTVHTAASNTLTIYIYMYMYTYMYIHNIYIHTYTIYFYGYIFTYMYTRPTQSIIYVPLQVPRFHKSILRIVQYKYLKSCSEDFILKNLILHTRSCSTAFITQHSWLLHFRQAEICLVEMICTTVVPARRGFLGGASP